MARTELHASGDYTIYCRRFPDELCAWSWFGSEMGSDPETCPHRIVREERAIPAEVAHEAALSVLMQLVSPHVPILEVLPPCLPGRTPPRVLYAALANEPGAARLLVIEAPLVPEGRPAAPRWEVRQT